MAELAFEEAQKEDTVSAYEAFLKELDDFYSLWYPRRKEGPIEVGSDMLIAFDNLLDSLWNHLPDDNDRYL